MHADEFASEPIPGLPERLPEGEVILWQGRPEWRALAVSALSLWWVAGYFALLAGLRFVAATGEMPLDLAFAAALPVLVLGAAACALLALFAWIQARCTLYTLTNRRVAMRIGAALTLTLNLPYARILSADLDLRKGGSGTIALSHEGPLRFSYLLCWPHVRPWRFSTEPALRCIPDAERVARLLAGAVTAEQRSTTPAPHTAQNVAAE